MFYIADLYPLVVFWVLSRRESMDYGSESSGSETMEAKIGCEASTTPVSSVGFGWKAQGC